MSLDREIGERIQREIRSNVDGVVLTYLSSVSLAKTGEMFSPSNWMWLYEMVTLIDRTEEPEKYFSSYERLMKVKNSSFPYPLDIYYLTQTKDWVLEIRFQMPFTSESYFGLIERCSYFTVEGKKAATKSKLYLERNQSFILELQRYILDTNPELRREILVHGDLVNLM